jgi:hypothetical protein
LVVARRLFADGRAEPAACRLVHVLFEVATAQRAAGRRARGYVTLGRLADVDADLEAAVAALDRGAEHEAARLAGQACGALITLVHPEIESDPDLFPPAPPTLQ